MQNGVNFLAMSLVGLVLAGCTGDNVSAGTAQLDKTYAGHKVDEFFASYGKPTGKPSEGSDSKIYHWVSVQPVVDQPMSAGFRGSPGIAIAEPDGPVEYSCEINIFTDRNGIIRKFTILNDSYSTYTSSYCDDLFASPPVHRTL